MLSALSSCCRTVCKMVRSGTQLMAMAYCAHCDDPVQDLWHGFPVEWDDVPEKIRRSWIRQRLVRRSTINRARNRAHGLR